MKGLFYFITALALVLMLSGCEEQCVEPTLPTSSIKASDAKQASNYTAHLRPEEETTQPVISNATGQIILKLSKDGTELYYKLIVANIATVRFGHLHYATVGEPGPIVVDIVGRTGNNPNGVISEGIITSASLKGPLAGKSLSDLIAAIEAGLIYANVHSDQYTAGEVRGQLK